MAHATENNGRPSVFDFTDYRAYLRAFYDWKKAAAPSYSHAVFAARAGLKSRSYLRLVLTGKRNLSPDTASKFILGLELGGDEGDAFLALVNFNQASTHEGRKMFWEKFLALRPRTKHAQRIHDEYSFLARMGYPILLILLRQPHAPHDAKSLAQMTGMTAAQVEEGIRTLVSLGALQEQGDGQYAASSPSFETTNEMPNVATQTFHKNMLMRASELVSLPPAEREFRSILVPLNQEEFRYIQKRVRDLGQEIDRLFSGSRPGSERVYALNMNLIPLTPDFIRRKAVEPSSQKPSEPGEPKEKTL